MHHKDHVIENSYQNDVTIFSIFSSAFLSKILVAHLLVWWPDDTVK